ncbi:MAG: sugar kinase [Clostridiales bacterium]|nr:sugar kinase [Clostridiales bacterium]
MNKKMIGFGDFMVRLSPPGYERFIQTDNYEVNYTGAEANVCVALAHMGMKTDFVTRLPDNDISRAGIAEMRKHGVGTDKIVFGGDRIGVFYLEKGAAQRPSKIVYDRKYTSVAMGESACYKWDEIFADGSWFHLTGITPALSKTIPGVCIDACRAAKEMGLTVSLDLNYRKNLWTPAEAFETIKQILPYVDVLMANEEDAEVVLGIKADGSDVMKGILSDEGYVNVAKKIEKEYGIHTVAISMRRSISASDNDWGAMYYKDGEAYFSKRYIIHLVDRVGGGDSFAAGLIYGLMNEFDNQHIIEYATATSCLKQTMEMDFSLSTAAEIEKLVGGNASGRVER